MADNKLKVDTTQIAVEPVEEEPALGADEAKLLRKLDLHILPVVMLLQTFSFIDRVNIGNARLYGLEADLGLVDNQYQMAVSIVFLTYLLFALPSNLVLKPFTPSRWIGFITTTWGVIATCSGLVQSFGALVACRLLLGAVESGLYPGMSVYLTFFYTKRELGVRFGFLVMGSALAGALGGLLAYGIGHMQGIEGLSGWRWIFIIQGLPSVVLGVSTIFLLPNTPDSARFLTAAEKRLMIDRLRRNYGDTESAQRFSKKDMVAAFTDWKVGAFCVGGFGACMMLYGYSVFLPTIINNLGDWTPAEVQLLTVPCYFLGAATYMVAVIMSDRIQMRGLFCVAFGTICVVGYGVLLSPAPAGGRYAGCFLVATGLYVLGGLPLVWLPNNTPRYGKRTTANAMVLTSCGLAGVVAPFTYTTAEAPRFSTGNAVSLSSVGMATGIFGFMWFWFARENGRRAAGKIHPAHQALSGEELMELGDDSPRYRYTV